MRGALFAVMMVLGGCATPAPAPRVALPEPCICPRSADCETSVVATGEPPDPAVLLQQVDAVERARALANVTKVTDEALDGAGVVEGATGLLEHLDPAVLEGDAEAAASAPENDLLRAVHELRDHMAREDATPAAERAILLWAAFDSEIERFREATTSAASERIADRLVASPNLAALIVKVAQTLPVYFASSEAGRVDLAERRAKSLLAEIVRPSAAKLADAIVAKRRGRFVVALNGKS